MPLDPGIAALLRLIEDSPYPPMHETTPDVARETLRAMTIGVVTDETRVPVGSVEAVDAGGVPARLYRPPGLAAIPLPTLVYLHGGGFVIGDLDTHDQLCRRLCAEAGAVVVSVDYRLAPEHRFPAAVDDALAAVRWAAAALDALGGAREDGGLLAVGGDSAGGNLAAVCAQALVGEVDAQLLIYPATHMAGDYPSRHQNGEGYYLDTATMTWFARQYLPEDADLGDPRHSPLLGSLAGAPPALVVSAEYDPLRDEGEAYADALTAAGVEVERVRYDGLVHGFVDMGLMSPAAAAAVEDVVARFRRLVGDGGTGGRPQVR